MQACSLRLDCLALHAIMWRRRCRENSEIFSRETERQHMHWQRYKLQLEEEDVCLYATICLFPKPNKETERRDYSRLAQVLANPHYYLIIFNRPGCNKLYHRSKGHFQTPAAILQTLIPGKQRGSERTTLSLHFCEAAKYTCKKTTNYLFRSN